MKGLRDERESGYQRREKMGIVPPGKEKNESERRMRQIYLRRRESRVATGQATCSLGKKESGESEKEKLGILRRKVGKYEVS
jgi:hypothetical protein